MQINIKNKLKIVYIGICCVLMLGGCRVAANEANAVETQIVTGDTESGQQVDNLITESTKESHSISTENIATTEEIVATESAATSDTPEPIQTNLTLLMVGDILLHTPVENAALQSDGTYDFAVIFRHTEEDIEAADLAIVNQEVIIGGEGLGISGYPAFNAPFAVGDALVDAGFDVVCHGTNHALDKGKKGLLNCINFWQENYPDVEVLGIHDSQESKDHMYIYEQGDMKIAILNYTYGTNGIPLPEGMPFAVDMLQEQQVIADIQKAEELADFTVVCPHWGTEYQLVQSAAQEKWAKLFAKYGADLVIGTHPHVIQPVEWVTDEETGHKMLVYYSIGNFVNWTSESGKGIANRMVGGMAKITLEQSKDGEIQIAEYGVEPVVCHLEQGVNGVTVYKLDDYTEELSEKNQIRLQDSAFSKEYCEQLCEKVWTGIW